MGIRLDGGTAFSGAVVTPFYDSLLVKVTSWGRDFREAVRRTERCLQEFRVRGVKTNIPFLIGLVDDPTFLAGNCTTRFIDETPELFEFTPRRDRATKLLQYIGDVIVNGQASVKDAPRATAPHSGPSAARSTLRLRCPRAPATNSRSSVSKSSVHGFANRSRLLWTDTTMRDAHQSLLATRVRTYDLLEIADAYAHNCAGLFSLEMWGGATFDTSMRFLKESPWQRLEQLRERIPNILFQMLLRASSAMGYANYPDNVVRECVREAAAAGIDVFRIFDALNWTPNMRVAMEATIEAGAICEAAICYTGDILDPRRPKYHLDYYVKLARELKSIGAHILAIKDMAGLVQAARGRQTRQNASRRNRHADPFPHARHGRRASRGDPQRGRSRPRHRRRRVGIDVGRHVAAKSEHARRKPAEHASRRQPRWRSARRYLGVLARGSRVLHAVRKSRARRWLRPVSARDAGRAVHEPLPASHGAGPVVALARSVPNLCGRQSTARRYRQGDAHIKSRGRHGAVPGRERPKLRRCHARRSRNRVSAIGPRSFRRADGASRRRLSPRRPRPNSARRKAAGRSPWRKHPAGRSRRDAAKDRQDGRGSSRPARTSSPISCIRKCSSN